MPKEKLLEALLADYPKASQVAAFFRQLMASVAETRKALHDDIKARLAEIRQPKDGYTPKKGVDYFDGYTPVKGKDYFDGKTPIKGVDYFDGAPGDNADPAAIIEEVAQKIPSMLTGEDVRNPLEALQGDERLRASAIAGLNELIKELTPSTGSARTGWGAHPLAILDGGVTKYKVARTLNFGSNLTVSVNASGVITIDATGGTLTELTATGTINSTNTAFTFVSKPTYVFVDGVKYRENEGWTWDSGTSTATTTKAPDYSIWGEA